MACTCVVVVREVWDTRDLVANPLDSAGGFRPGGMETRFEPEDLNALEMALRLKDAQGGKVIALSVGDSKNVDVLRECLYRGVDEVRKIAVDPAALDDQALGALIAGAIAKLGPCDLVLVGTAIPDAENSQLGSCIAAAMGVDQVSWVDAIEECGNGRAVAKRAVEMGSEFVEVRFPALLSVGVALLEDDPRAPRPAKAMLKLKMKKTEIPSFSAADAGVADPAARIATRVAGREAIPPRVVASKDVNPEDPAALQAMLNEVTKGE